MSRFKIKNLPPIRLVDLLRKRKTNLKNFLSTSGIVAYSTLLQKCEKMGVSPPTEEEFKEALGNPVSSPQEGVVVLDPPQLVKDLTGEKIEVDNLATEKLVNVELASKKNEKKTEKSIKIDESVYITNVDEAFVEKSEASLGDASSVEDDLESSISKLSNLKKTK
jgi:hypothetical protein